MSLEQSRTEESVQSSMIDNGNKSLINDRTNKNFSIKNEETQPNQQSENSKNNLQSNSQTICTSTQNATKNSSNSNLINQMAFSTVAKASSKENLAHRNLHHHQSHTNLWNFSSLNEHLSAAIVNTNQNISALDLPPTREVYKSRKKIYQQEKKKLAEQLLSTLNDPTVILLADWLKVRTSFKAWSKVYCELRPGVLVIYKSAKVHKSGVWIGTVLLNICNVIERPSKKGGFCFKIFSQVNDQNIWANIGPRNEKGFGALTLPLPLSYLMFRANNQSGIRWMKAINLSFQFSKQMIRNDISNSIKDLKLNTELFNRLLDDEDILKDEHEIEHHFNDQDLTDDHSSDEHNNRSTDTDTTGSIENDFESSHHLATNKHCKEQFDDKQLTIKRRMIKTGQNNEATPNLSSQSSQDSKTRSSRQLITLKQSASGISINDQLDQTEYIYQPEDQKFGVDEHSQEETGEENKSLIWSLLKQVRPGDLSKVVLPTFILEPRSFLEKLTDYYYHCDILASANLQNDPFERIKQVVSWYLSGMYKKPNGLKKPYNPILGERYRCYWEQPSIIDNQTTADQFSKTFYVAEQLSHHPPVSAFHCVNRNQGYLVNGVVQVSSNYYGNSVSAILQGKIKLSLINRSEDYIMNFPYAHCAGILFGGLTFELGGKVQIVCPRTTYSCDLEFKLKPFLGGEMNVVTGKIKLGNETLANIEGHWDSVIRIKEKLTGKQSILWEVNQSTFSRRLKRFTVPIEKQEDFESMKLWKKVSDAIQIGDQKQATIEKTKLEDKQRKDAKFRLENDVTYYPQLFELDNLTNEWHYKWEDSRIWDCHRDVLQFEKSFIIQTLTKHRSKTSLTNLNALTNNCKIVDLSPSIMNRSTFSNLTAQNTIIRKRPSKLAKTKQDHLLIGKTEKNDDDDSFDKFDSIGGDEEDTDYSATHKEKSSIFTSKLLKRIEQNENDFKKSLASLKLRQQKLEQILIEERQRSSNQLSRLFDGDVFSFFSLPNLIAIFILTVIIQLIIYKFTNYFYPRK